MKKRFVSVLFSLAIIFSMMSGFTVTSFADGEIATLKKGTETIGSYSTIKAAFDAYNNQTDYGDYTITVKAGNYSVDYCTVVQSLEHPKHLTIRPENYSDEVLMKPSGEGDCYFIFLMDGQSAGNTDNNFTVENISFDLSGLKEKNIQCGVLYYGAGGSGKEDPMWPEDSLSITHRYAHNVTFRNCSVYSQDEKNEKAMFAYTTGNSSPAALTIDGCTVNNIGYVVNGHFPYNTAYGDDKFSIKILDTDANNIKCFINNQIGEYSKVYVDGCNVNFYHDYAIRCKNGLMEVKNSTFTSTYDSVDVGGILVMRDGTGDRLISVYNCTFNKVSDNIYDTFNDKKSETTIKLDDVVVATLNSENSYCYNFPKEISTKDVIPGSPVVSCDSENTVVKEATKIFENNDILGINDVTADAEIILSGDLYNEYFKSAKMIEELSGCSIKLIIQPYFDVKVTDGTSSDAKITSITYDITVKYNILATTSDAFNTENAYIISKEQTLNVTRPVTLTIPLPASFNVSSGDSLAVMHIHDQSKYIYDGVVSSSDSLKTVTFINHDGFSEFIIMSPNLLTGAKIGNQLFNTLQEAINAVENDETIELLSNTSETITIGREVSFKINNNGFDLTSNISAADGYTLTISGDTYTVTRSGDEPGPTHGPSPTPTPSSDSTPQLEQIELIAAKTSGNKAIKLSWLKIDGATKYGLYGAKCGKAYKLIKSTTNNTYTVKKLYGKKLKTHKYYKFYVVAYYNNGNALKSPSIHFITGNTCGKYANVKSIKPKYDNMLLSIGVNKKIGAVCKTYRGKKKIRKSHGTALRFISNNPNVVKVDANGVVTAVSKGKATIYIQNIGGKYCKTEVVVE